MARDPGTAHTGVGGVCILNVRRAVHRGLSLGEGVLAHTLRGVRHDTQPHAVTHSFIHSFIQVSHSSTHGTGTRCATRNTTPHLRSILCQKQVVSPASPSTSSDAPSSVSCVCVTFLLTGGSCRSLLCRSVWYLVRVAVCSDLWFFSPLTASSGRMRSGLHPRGASQLRLHLPSGCTSGPLGWTSRYHVSFP